jgi:hypothetical protein
MRQARDPGAYVLLSFLRFFVQLSIAVLVLVGGVATAWRCVSVILGPTAVERTAAGPPAGQYR